MGQLLTPSELIDLLIDRAPKLRAAGVISINVLGPEHYSLTLAEHVPEPAGVTAEDLERYARALDGRQDEPEDPLDDPATYGRTSSVPGFDLSEEESDTDEP